MKQEPEKPAFDAYAADYDALIQDPIRDRFAESSRFFFERKLELIRDFFGRMKTDPRRLSWLDVGCGKGDLLRAGAASFKSAAGCDPSEAMLRSCTDLDVRKQPAPEALPFEDAAFDFITIICVYHHIAEERRELFTRETMRVLKPDGIVCVIEHNPLNPVTQIIVSRTPVDADARLLTAGKARRLLRSCSVDILETRYFLLMPERMYGRLGFLENLLHGAPLGGQYSVFARNRTPGT
jgi:SAM-dependent methyltransferase